MRRSTAVSVAGDIEEDLWDIARLMRSKLEIRNRSHMKRIHKNCFVGADAVSWMVDQGFAASRDEAVQIGQRMMDKKYFRHVSDSHSFRDENAYYRFVMDESNVADLPVFAAGNGNLVHFGEGGNKWSFAPHTAHNSYILNISLAEDLERAVAGASVDSRRRAVNHIRDRVRALSSEQSPDWMLVKTTMVNQSEVQVFQRKRPRGNFYNMKVVGYARATPRAFIAAMMDFEKRKTWESTFVDGVVVEAIDIGETNPFWDGESGEGGEAAENGADVPPPPATDPSTPPPAAASHASKPVIATPSSPTPNPEVARPIDDVQTYLSNVDLSECPEGMPIALLNDPLRQEALAHLRRQMIASNPDRCMLCNQSVSRPGDLRFCPCCGSLCCTTCASKKVFEVISRQETIVCVHCYRESSRIRHPPQEITNQGAVDQNMRGKWWRPQELGLEDYSHSKAQPSRWAQQLQGMRIGEDEHSVHSPGSPANEPVSPGSNGAAAPAAEEGTSPRAAPEAAAAAEQVTEQPSPAQPAAQPAAPQTKWARCKNCGERVERTVEAMEQHTATCQRARDDMRSVAISTVDAAGADMLGGVLRRKELNSAGTRVIYRTATAPSALFRHREMCTFQDSFMDEDGSCYMYETSVRHVDVRGTEGYVTAEVLLLLYIAQPVPGRNGTCKVTVISQVDAKTRAPGWMRSIIPDYSNIGASSPADLIRELRSQGKLSDILSEETEQTEASTATAQQNKVTLDDFELLAVLGRGGFGKVMQVRHRSTGQIFAMKILKKGELTKRKQIERTRTERSILAAVRHPFIVRLWYAFQNAQKLYMVMDFVQGGDFFTLLRKFRRLPESWVKIYAAEIAMALQHLHDRDIVYRDLKPENVLLESDGHLKLTDFGLSRFFETRPALPEDSLVPDEAITRSFCGTEQYMPPEMLLQQGHTWRMDWWCLGLLIHEMITARHPFQGPTHYDTLRNMVSKQPLLDPRLSPAAALIVKGFLVKNAKSRLCCKDGISELYGMQFFEGLDWQALYEKRIPAPYVPETSDEADISNFETQFTREAPLDSVVAPTKTKGPAKQGGGLMGFFGFDFNGDAKNRQNTDSNSEQQFSGFSFTNELLAGDDDND